MIFSGTILLDFDADACQSPSRAFLLDVTLPEDHARGLSTFTIMAGLGGFMGYSMGGINWDDFFIGQMLGGNLRAVFTLITIIFIVCVFMTITSFPEIPLWMIETNAMSPMKNNFYTGIDSSATTDQPETTKKNDSMENSISEVSKCYGTVDELKISVIFIIIIIKNYDLSI